MTPQREMNSGTGEGAEPRGEPDWPRGDAIDELLGFDPTPTLSPEAMRAMYARLAPEGDGGLDALLGLDDVETPSGLAEGVLARVASEAVAVRRRRRLRVLPILAAAAAGIAVVVLGGRNSGRGEAGDPTTGAPSTLAGVGTSGAGERSIGDPSDDFLAALPALENMQFLGEELDPVEADALFLMDAEETLLLDLLEMGD